MIFILGYKGYIGSHFYSYFKKNNIEFDVLERTQIDNLDKGILKNNDILINAAGFTGKPNVDDCENHKLECFESNSLLPVKLNLVCKKVGAKFCHISSGCLYDGYEKEFNEDDLPNFSFKQNNCSWYSGTKALGEELLDKNTCYILRLRLPFNYELNNERNYLNKLIKYNKLINVSNSITNLDEFIKCATNIITNNCPFGIYNIVNNYPIDTKMIVFLLKKYNLINEKEWFFNYEEFESTIKTKRSNCVLSTRKIRRLGLGLTDVLYSVEKAILDYKKL